nr:hypothetical protein [Rhodopirellula sp. JC639]
MRSKQTPERARAAIVLATSATNKSVTFSIDVPCSDNGPRKPAVPSFGDSTITTAALGLDHHPDKLRDGFCSGLSEDVMTPRLDGPNAQIQSIGDRFVWVPLDQQIKHFTFFGRQFGQTPAHGGMLRIDPPSAFLVGEGLLNGVPQRLLADRLFQDVDRTLFHRPHRKWDFPMRGDEQDRQGNALVDQSILQLDSADSQQPEFRDDAPRRAARVCFYKVLAACVVPEIEVHLIRDPADDPPGQGIRVDQKQGGRLGHQTKFPGWIVVGQNGVSQNEDLG